MRLLNVRSRRLEEFFEKTVPKFAILSHTWGDDEITFQQLQKHPKAARTIKINGCCRQALIHGYDYVWIDTCCIDKSSSAELSEAINSMYSWYSLAGRCLVYLDDVPSKNTALEEIKKCRWFTRGWTLQELLAPFRLTFFARDWTQLEELEKSYSSSMVPRFCTLLSKATGIPVAHLCTPFKPDEVPVAQKINWASRRVTTRKEDEAYCLLGLFNVNMPLLYGEGPRAFIRLQHEIMEASDDHTLFAWGYGKYSHWDPKADQKLAFVSHGLAASAWNFHNTPDVWPYKPDWLKSSHYYKTNKGILMKLPVLELPNCDAILVALNCSISPHSGTILALPIIRLGTDLDVYERFADSVPVLVPESAFRNSECRRIYITSDARHESLISSFQVRVNIDLNTFWDQDFSLSLIYPPPLGVQLNPTQKFMTLEFPDPGGFTTRFSTILQLNSENHGSVLLSFTAEPGQSDLATSGIPATTWDQAFVRFYKVFQFSKAPYPPYMDPSSRSFLIDCVVSYGRGFERSLDWFVLERSGRFVIRDDVAASLAVTRTRDEVSLLYSANESVVFNDPLSGQISASAQRGTRNCVLECSSQQRISSLISNSPPIAPKLPAELEGRSPPKGHGKSQIYELEGRSLPEGHGKSQIYKLDKRSIQSRGQKAAEAERGLTQFPTNPTKLCNMCKKELTNGLGEAYDGTILPTRCYNCFHEGLTLGWNSFEALHRTKESSAYIINESRYHTYYESGCPPWQ